jgi:ubiquinone/menaquinone biosynthesis C-methylase UbiE
VPDGFDSPTRLPASADEADRWQEANRSWWQSHPMRYDWKEPIRSAEFTKEFYEEIDARFFENARQFMPWRRIPFDPLIPFDRLGDKDVLEIGVGNGSHAQLLARHARSFTGIDITDYAVDATRRRMRVLGLENAAVERMDAERLAFPDASFDFIWSWGVIHHTANTRRVLQEMHRVLRPGGTAVTMVYHRSFWQYYVLGGFFRGVLQGDLLRTRSLAKTVQRFTDGAMARYYTRSEWAALVSEFFTVNSIAIYGSEAELVPLPGGTLKSAIMRLIPDALSRFLTNRCGMGMFLVSTMEKRG